MTAPRNIAHELGLLRRVVQNIAVKPLPNGHVTQEILQAAGFSRARIAPVGFVGILWPGSDAFSEFSEKLFSKSPRIERGISIEAYQDEFLNILLSRYVEHGPDTVKDADVFLIEAHLTDWFSKRATTRTSFVPCVITPWRSPRFSVGPVSFIFLEDILSSEYNPRNYAVERTDVQRQVTFSEFDDFLDVMCKERAHWLAVVAVEGCEKQRALEIGDLAVDLAIVAFQLAQPYLGTKNMSRLSTRRGPGFKLTLSKSEELFAVGRTNAQPGLSIGQGYLGEIIGEAAPLITAVGNRVQSFTTGSFKLPKIEQAWCDAAYWLHQGLAEPLDSIAVAKLETAIEVLFCAGSSSGSQARIMAALETFYGLKPDDRITQNNPLTAKEFSKRFVRDRSRILHGTWSTLNTRLGSSRNGLDNLAITLVRAAAMEIDLYIQSVCPRDDVEAFLLWVKKSRDSQIKEQKEQCGSKAE